jgi:hypothetical protein
VRAPLPAFAVFTLCAAAHAQTATPSLIGSAHIPGNARDRSGLAGRILTNAGGDTGLPADLFGGAGSAIDYTGADDLYLMASDRGPSDGDARYPARVHTVRITVRPGDARPVTAAVVGTTLLTDAAGRPYDGSAAALSASAGETLRLDPEGLRVAADRSFWVADEYGPFVFHFDVRGKQLGAFHLPPKFMAATASANADVELFSNLLGRQPNRGMEGLALTPDGRTLVGILQSPLIQDHAVDAEFKRAGQLIRIVTMDLAAGGTHEYVYPLASGKLGVNEILAIDGTRFLVIERDGKGGAAARTKHVYAIDLAGATDVSAPVAAGGRTIDYTGATPDTGLPGALPAGITPARKRLFLDLLDPAYRLAGEAMPEKVEGLAWGPPLPGGDRLLLVTTDNDFRPDAPTDIHAFRVPPAALVAGSAGH